MRAFLTAITFTCLVFFAPCAAQTVQGQSDTINTQSAATHEATTGYTCAFEHPRGETASYPNCIFQDDQGNLFIAQEYVKKLEFDSHGLAVECHDVHSGHLFMYVNREGCVIIKDVRISDNWAEKFWAEKFSDGLVLIVVNEKCGFADRQGKIVIAPKYDGASPFEHGYAVVCLGCRKTCAATDPPESRLDVCEYHMTGGEWFKINKAGLVVAKVPH